MQLKRYLMRRTLGWHLFLIVLLKMVVLYALWSVFIQPNKIQVNQNDLDCLYNSRAQQCAHGFSNPHDSGESR